MTAENSAISSSRSSIGAIALSGSSRGASISENSAAGTSPPPRFSTSTAAATPVRSASRGSRAPARASSSSIDGSGSPVAEASACRPSQESRRPRCEAATVSTRARSRPASVGVGPIAQPLDQVQRRLLNRRRLVDQGFDGNDRGALTHRGVAACGASDQLERGEHGPLGAGEQGRSDRLDKRPGIDPAGLLQRVERLQGEFHRRGIAAGQQAKVAPDPLGALVEGRPERLVHPGEPLRPILVEVAFEPGEAGVEQARPRYPALGREAASEARRRRTNVSRYSGMGLRLEDLPDLFVEQPGIVEQALANAAGPRDDPGSRGSCPWRYSGRRGRSQSPSRTNRRTSRQRSGRRTTLAAPADREDQLRPFPEPRWTPGRQHGHGVLDDRRNAALGPASSAR